MGSGAVGVSEVEGAGGGSVYADGVDAVAGPVAYDGYVAGGSVYGQDVVGSGGVGVSEVEGAGGGSVYADGVDAVAGPVAYDGYVAGGSVYGQDVVGSGGVEVPEEEAVGGGSVNADGRNGDGGGVGGRAVLAARVVVGGAVVGLGCGRAARIEHPRRRAGHHPAGDPSATRDVHVTLPISKLGTPDVAVVAVAKSALTYEFVTRRAEDAATAAAAVALTHAVDVVPRPGAVDRSVRLPPTSGEGSNWTGVDPIVDGAAELGVSVTAEIRAVAIGPRGALAYGRVSGTGPDEEVDRRDRQRRSRDRGLGQKATPGGTGEKELA